jgi:hypothetical protein
MTMISQRLVSEYSGKDAGCDVLIQRYIQLEGDINAWREQIAMDGLVFETAPGFKFAHPLLKHLLAGEKQQHYTLRELMFSVRLADFRKDEVDDVDTFLEQMTQTNRPHFGRIRGE